MTTLPAPPLRLVEAVLTTACDLRCRYCWQRRRDGPAMPWSRLRRVIDRLAREPSGEIHFYGGEPLLRFALIRRALERLPRSITPLITTNGLGLTPHRVQVLAAHPVSVRLSFDGTPAVQSIRGAGTFDTLDRRLRQMRASHPRWFRNHLQVLMTVTPAAAGRLTESVGYFIERGVQDLGLTPAMMPSAAWPAGRLDRLAADIDEIERQSRLHYERTGAIPVRFLRGGPPGGHGRARRKLCGAAEAGAAVIDPEGGAFGCGLAATTLTRVADRLPPPLRDALTYDGIESPGFDRGRAALSTRAAVARIFHDRPERRGQAGPCRECPDRAGCSVCPLAFVFEAAPRDPDRVPDYLCAWNRATLAARRRFQRAIRRREGPLTAGRPDLGGSLAERRAMRHFDQLVARRESTRARRPVRRSGGHPPRP